MTCPFARDDGAYVLGALSPSERADFEQHLSGCRSCRNAVAELAVIPGLLGRLDSEVASQLSGGGIIPDDSRLPRLVRAVQAERRRQRIRHWWRLAGVALASASLSLAVGTGVNLPARFHGNPEPVAMVSMLPIDVDRSGPVTAEVAIADVAGGTEVTMHCAYHSQTIYHEPWTLRLYAYDHQGRVEQVGSWVAGPGDELTFGGLVRFSRPELARLELQKGDGTPLLVYAFD